MSKLKYIPSSSNNATSAEDNSVSELLVEGEGQGNGDAVLELHNSL